jgi:DNA topoisomerase IB
MIRKKKLNLKKYISLCKIQKPFHTLQQELKSKLQPQKPFKPGELKKKLNNFKCN